MNVNRDKLESIRDHAMNEIEGAEVSVFVKQKRPQVETYTMFFQAVNGILVKALTPASCKVLLYMISHAQYGNYITKQVDWIAEDLALSKPTTLRAIKQLVSLNIILKVPNPSDKRQNDYYLNPTQSWKGQVKERDKAMKYLQSNVGKQLNLLDAIDESE